MLCVVAFLLMFSPNALDVIAGLVKRKKIFASHHCLQQQPTTGYKPNACNGPKCVYRPNKDKQTIRTEEEKRT